LKIFSNRKIRLLGAVVFAILAYFFIIKIERFKNEEFSQNSQETEATIVDYQIKGAGAGLDHISTLEYEINNKLYQKSVNTSVRFTKCYESRECIGRKFILYYKIDNPNEVRIDFDRPIRDFPKINKLVS